MSWSKDDLIVGKTVSIRPYEGSLLVTGKIKHIGVEAITVDCKDYDGNMYYVTKKEVVYVSV
jgi:hypothetical protein